MTMARRRPRPQAIMENTEPTLTRSTRRPMKKPGQENRPSTDYLFNREKEPEPEYRIDFAAMTASAFIEPNPGHAEYPRPKKEAQPKAAPRMLFEEKIEEAEEEPQRIEIFDSPNTASKDTLEENPQRIEIFDEPRVAAEVSEETTMEAETQAEEPERVEIFDEPPHMEAKISIEEKPLFEMAAKEDEPEDSTASLFAFDEPKRKGMSQEDKDAFETRYEKWQGIRMHSMIAAVAFAIIAAAFSVTGNNILMAFGYVGFFAAGISWMFAGKKIDDVKAQYRYFDKISAIPS